MFSDATTGIRRASDSLAALFVISVWQIGSHWWLLDLPFFWDEAGYYVPAARDFFTSGVLVPVSVPSSGHPPLLSMYLSVSWHLLGQSLIVTRLSILLISTLGLYCVFLLGCHFRDRVTGLLSTLTVSCFPLYFAQSTMVLPDLPSASLSLLGIVLFVRGKRGAIFASAAASLFKETAVLVPAGLLLYTAIEAIAASIFRVNVAQHRRRRRIALQMLLVSVISLSMWYGYHLSVTGFVFGNPTFFSYNFIENLDVFRTVIGVLYRFWHSLGHLGLFCLTLPAIVVFVRKVPTNVNYLCLLGICGCVLLVHVCALSVLGGAVLARYMLAVIPLVIVSCICLLRKYYAVLAVTLIAFLLHLPGNLPYNYAVEETIKYAEFVRVHRKASQYISQNLSDSEIVTSWPATFELTRPDLGYVAAPIKVFERDFLDQAQMKSFLQGSSDHRVVMLFNRNYDPGESILRPRRLLSLIPFWRTTSDRIGTREAFNRYVAAGSKEIQVVKHWEDGSFYVTLIRGRSTASGGD